MKRPAQFAVLAASLAFGLAACASGTPSAGSPPAVSPTGAGSPSGAATTSPGTASTTPTKTPKPTPKPTATRTPTKPAPPTGTTTTTKYVFPVIGSVTYAHTHHDYPATDIIAACGLTYRSPVNGVVLEVNRVDTWKASTNLGPDRGGLSISIKGDDGVRYYGSHFEKINANVKPGLRVTAGEHLALVGRTGDASGCHVHFGISPVCAGTGDWYNRRGLIYPWPYLDSWRAGGQLSPVKAVAAWQKTNGCPTKPLVDP